jgi:hypothetical protein
MDADHLAIERFYQSLKNDGVRSILPLIGNVADASPNLGGVVRSERRSMTGATRSDLPGINPPRRHWRQYPAQGIR